VLKVHKSCFSTIADCTPDSSHATIRFVDAKNADKTVVVCGLLMGCPFTDNNGKGFMHVMFKFLEGKLT
jgi:hypothetical protein